MRRGHNATAFAASAPTGREATMGNRPGLLLLRVFPFFAVRPLLLRGPRHRGRAAICPHASTPGAG